MAFVFEHRMASFSKSEIEALIPKMEETFIDSVSRIAAAAETNGIQFLPVLQPMKNELQTVPTTSLTYEQEADLVRERLAGGERVLLPEMQILLHSQINRRFRRSLRTSRSRYVDFIEIMEENDARGEFTSWVHLSARANRLLARSIEQEVLQLACETGR